MSGLIIALLFAPGILSAQEETDFVTIKIVKNENGVVTTTDTSFSCAPDYDIQNILTTLGLNCGPQMTEDLQNDSLKKIIIKTEKVIITGDSSDIGMTIATNCGGSGDSIRIMTTVGDDNQVTVRMDGEGSSTATCQKKVVVISDGQDINADLSNLQNVSMSVMIVRVKMENPNDNEKRAIMSETKVLGMDEIKIQDLKFFPNPGNGKFDLTFSLPETADLEINVKDVNGKNVFNEKTKNFQGEYSKQIDLSDRAKGIYFMTITHGKKNLIKKLIIE